MLCLNVRCALVQLDVNLIHALQLDVPHVIPLTSSGDVMTVTLIDARHCPGSVMFVFDGYFGRILYTGSFRYEEDRLDQGWLSELKSNPVDVLYIDNTFCSPKCVLPTRQEAKRQIIDIIEQHSRQRVVFGLRGLGKVDILISLAKLFDVKITVSKDRYRLLEVLALHEHFVIAGEGSEQTRFEVIELVEITRSSVDAWNRTAPTIAILLTGLFVGVGYQPFTRSSDIFVVPLSDHSPYAELHEFVARIRPKSVVPILRSDPRSREDPLAACLPNRTNVECFAELLDQSPIQNYHIPPAVFAMMNRTENARGQAHKQTFSCSKSVSINSLHLTSPGQKLRKLLPKVLASTSSVISAAAVTSYGKSDCVRWKRTNSCNTLTSAIAKKPLVTVRPMMRCLPPDRCLQSPFIKQRQQHQWVNYPTSSELRQRRFRNEMLRQLRKRNSLSTCTINSPASSTASKLNVLPAGADALSLTKYSDETCERQARMSVSTTGNVACDSSSTIYHVRHNVSASGDSKSKNHADILWQSSESGDSHPISHQLAEPRANVDGTMTGPSRDIDCHQGSGRINETNASGSVLTSVSHIKTLVHGGVGASCLTTFSTAIVQPTSQQIPDSCSSLLHTGIHSDNVQRHSGDSSSLAEDHLVRFVSDPCEQLHRISGTADTVLVDGTVATKVSVPCEILPSNQIQRVDEAEHSTASEIDVGSQLVVNDPISHSFLEQKSSVKLSRYHTESSCSFNTVLPMTVVDLSVSGSEEMSAREKLSSTRLEVDMSLNSHCDNTVLAGSMGNVGLPGDLDAYCNHAREVLPVNGIHYEIGTHSMSNAVQKSIALACKSAEQRYNAEDAVSTKVVNLHPKKKWRKQFRAAHADASFTLGKSSTLLSINVSQS